MRRGLFICMALCLLCGTSRAQKDTVDVILPDMPVKADSLNKADTVLSDADILRMLATAGRDTVVRIADKGKDVSTLVNSRRARATDITPFKSESFFDNTFASLRFTSLSLLNADYSVGLQGGLSFGKWFHQDHALKVNFDIGQWHDNFDVSPIMGMELGASYIFNLTSYAFGYRTNRFCEFMIAGGAGYASSALVRRTDNGVLRKSGKAFTGHVGALLNLRVFKNIDFFLEPQVAIYSNGMAVSYAGNWRSWMTAFRGTFGLTYNIKPSHSEDSPRLSGRKDGYFVSFMGGPSLQNSRVVYDFLGINRGLGIHVALGVGKYYTDYFAMRYTGSYQRNGWMLHDDKEYPCNYFALRAEGMFDIVSVIRQSMTDRKRSGTALSLIFGPEIGYMYKVDNNMVLQGLYMGMAGGVQVKFHLAPRLSLFLEPRFSMVWYDGPSNSATTVNDHRNYYDGLLDLNAGIEFML